jgi:hypothetical protein
MILSFGALILGVFCMFSGFFVIASGAAFSGVAMFLGCLVTAFGCDLVVVCVRGGYGFCFGGGHGVSPDGWN